MKWMFTIIFLVSVFLRAQAQQAPTFSGKLAPSELAVFMVSEYKTYKFQSLDKIEFSEGCLKDQKKCEALRASKNKFKLPPAPHPSMFHPAALYCKAMAGKAMIGLNSEGSDVDICMFPDGSIVKSWGVFYKHFPPKVIQ